MSAIYELCKWYKNCRPVTSDEEKTLIINEQKKILATIEKNNFVITRSVWSDFVTADLMREGLKYLDPESITNGTNTLKNFRLWAEFLENPEFKNEMEKWIEDNKLDARSESKEDPMDILKRLHSPRDCDPAPVPKR